MKVAIISGSHRNESQSARIAEFLAKRAGELNKTVTTDVIDLGKNSLPLWDESMWGQEGVAASAWAPIKTRLENADATIIIAAEWNGTAPAALKNFFHYVGGGDLAHKAGLLVSVTSSATNGAYPIAEMRATSSKNSKVNYIPDHLIIRNVTETFVEDGAEADSYMKERVDSTLQVFFEYAKALNTVRKSEAVKNMPSKFAFGQ